MDFFKKYKKEISISLAASTLVGFGLFIFWRNRAPKIKVLSKEQLKEVKKIIPIYDGKHLTIWSIVQIQSLILGASVLKVESLRAGFRETRRKHINNLKEYISASRQYEQQEAEIIQPIQDDIFAILNLSPESWEASNKYYADEVNEEYLTSISGLTNQLKALRAKRRIDKEDLINVLNDIETIIEDNEGTLIDLAELVQQNSVSFATIENWIYDNLYDIHGIEEEDFIAGIKEDPLIKVEFDRVSKKIIQFTKPNSLNG